MRNDEEQDKYASVKRKMRMIGGTILCVGIFLFIAGVALQIGAFTSMGIDSNPETVFTRFSIGGLLDFLGFSMIGFGGMILWFSFIGVVYRYLAREVKPAVTDLSEGTGTGLSRGSRRGGGIQFNINDRGPAGKRDIRIRCRKCRHLESEDAKFCSNCGSRL